MKEEEIEYSFLWLHVWVHWYRLIDSFFWYVWKPCWMFVLSLPLFIEQMMVDRLNTKQKEDDPDSKPIFPTVVYAIFDFLMFQCPNCRSSHLYELWEKRAVRHGQLTLEQCHHYSPS